MGREDVIVHLSRAKRQMIDGWIYKLVRPDVAKEAVERLKLQPQWIPVSERLPEDGSDILAYYDNGIETRIIACNYYKGEWFDCVFNTETVFKYITHWMPLPKPPKEGDGE